jgi:hypothetical protein
VTDTVFLLGAGFSKPAGIPLLGEFVDYMLQISARGVRQKDKSFMELPVVRDAMKIRNELDGYHGRANFDDRNIEDLLSILTFNVLGGGKKDRQKLTLMAQAIAETIEACCEVRHPGIKPGRGEVVSDGPDLYRRFWKALFKATESGRRMPTLLTFNYDLVLERSLLQVLSGTSYGVSRRPPFDRFRLTYGTDHVPDSQYKLVYTNYHSDRNRGSMYEEGTILENEPTSPNSGALPIEILKLHGSLNFPLNRWNEQASDFTWWAPTREPYILPPVFNKITGAGLDRTWRRALDRLRNARSIVIVGYSLPQTDIYMQYFLKAAVGPNLDLDRIVVFDPVLFSTGERRDAMQTRYETCFSTQLRRRIQFTPTTNPPSVPSGTTEALIAMLEESPSKLLF